MFVSPGGISRVLPDTTHHFTYTCTDMLRLPPLTKRHDKGANTYKCKRPHSCLHLIDYHLWDRKILFYY